MDDSVKEFLRTQPERKRVKAKTQRVKQDMSRAQMTVWICATLMVLGAGGLYFGTRMHPMERDAECQTLFGMDKDCQLANAVVRLRGNAPAPGTDPLGDPVAMTETP